MAISKKLRQQVYEKYNGLCGYTGKPLDDKWQVDHIIPQCHFRRRNYLKTMNCNDINNLIPTIRIVNHYKRSLGLEGFRKRITTLHIRLKNLPKKTRVVATEKRKRYLLEVAEHFGITQDIPFKGVFYFETVSLPPKV